MSKASYFVAERGLASGAKIATILKIVVLGPAVWPQDHARALKEEMTLQRLNAAVMRNEGLSRAEIEQELRNAGTFVLALPVIQEAAGNGSERYEASYLLKAKELGVAKIGILSLGPRVALRHQKLFGNTVSFVTVGGYEEFTEFSNAYPKLKTVIAPFGNFPWIARKISTV